MPLLFHWRGKNYKADMENSDPYTYNLNQNSPIMLNAKSGDTIWAFTRREKDKVYVLAVRGIIQKCSKNKPGFKYGANRVELDRAQTDYFDVNEGLDVERVIRSLSITAQAQILGLSFQGRNGVREITQADNEKLQKFAKQLRTIAV